MHECVIGDLSSDVVRFLYGFVVTGRRAHGLVTEEEGAARYVGQLLVCHFKQIVCFSSSELKAYKVSL